METLDSEYRLGKSWDELLKEYENTKPSSEPEKKSKEERFWGLMLETDSLKIDKAHPNSTFGFKGDKFLWEYDSQNGFLYLSYPIIWSVIEEEYDLGYSEIQAFIKIEVEQHFKCKGVTPNHDMLTRSRQVEQHFKSK
jgi:hypothetical protein